MRVVVLLLALTVVGFVDASAPPPAALNDESNAASVEFVAAFDQTIVNELSGLGTSIAVEAEDDAPEFYYERAELGADTTGRRWWAAWRSRPAAGDVDCQVHCDNQPAGLIEGIRMKWASNFDASNLELASWRGWTFLVVWRDGAWGSGVWSTDYDWYLLDGNAALLVHNMPATGHVHGWGMVFDRDYSVNWTAVPGHTPRIRVRAQAHWTTYVSGEDADLQTVLEYDMDWNPKSLRFEATGVGKYRDPQEFWRDGTDEFVLHNRWEILRFVQTSKDNPNEWLTRLLEDCKIIEARDLVQGWLQIRGQG